MPTFRRAASQMDLEELDMSVALKALEVRAKLSRSAVPNPETTATRTSKGTLSSLLGAA